MSERLVAGELRRLRRSALWPDRGAPAGDGRTLVLIPGVGVPPRTVRSLGRWLEGGGWQVRIPDLGWNVGCGEAAVAAISALIDAAPEPVTIVGHSRGGLLGRVAAVRAGADVATLVSVCTPWTIGPPDRPGVELGNRMLGFARAHGLSRFASIKCADGPCCERFRHDMAQVPAARWTLLWSSRDSIASDEARAEGADATIDLGTSHLGAVLSVEGWQAIADAIAAD